MIVFDLPGIDRIILHNPATNNRFDSSDLDAELIKQCRHFHFGYPPLMEKMFENDGEELKKVFQIAKQAGATTSCDMTLPDPDSVSGKAPWRKILENILPYVDIFVPSFEEAYYLLYPEEFLKMKAEHDNAELIDHLAPKDYSRIADEILSMGCKITTLKAGHRGFYIKTNSKGSFETLGAAKPGDVDNWSNRELWSPAFKSKHFSSATGAGDSSIAGFLTAFLRGRAIEEALKYAVCCGMQNVQSLDAVGGMKPWDETTKMLHENLPMMETHIDAADWKWSDEYDLWAGPGDPLSS